MTHLVLVCILHGYPRALLSCLAPTFRPRTLWFGILRQTHHPPLPPCCSGMADAASSGWPVCGDPSSGKHLSFRILLLLRHPPQVGIGRGSIEHQGSPPEHGGPHCHCRNLLNPGRQISLDLMRCLSKSTKGCMGKKQSGTILWLICRNNIQIILKGDL